MAFNPYLCKIKLENMGLIIWGLAIGVVLEAIWSPRLDWIDEENMLILHYNKKNTRNYLVIIKF